ncbi:MAG: TatD family hydrolase [Nanoarchaeota archaeon]|nr:TatD family hydrolase [Nanoarchaeota archaeon]MBU1623054.1 TatD family hydrolase [Nanoarchaeota archaeon]MBU1974442.1 TatD family hydrolase [Nanoarchaeota archaeon]
MNLVDVHCHLNHKLFKNDLDKVLQRAKKVGVKVIIVSGVNPAANKEVLKLAEKYPLIKVSLGIYPIDALGLGVDEVGLPRHIGKIDLEKEFKFIKKNKDKIVAVGEVGLDFHWDEKHHQEQKDNFRKIIKFVKAIKKPILIHSRKAEEECLDILEEEINGEIPVIMHCFSGRKALMTKAIEQGYYFSIPPHIVKSSGFQTLVKKAPLKQLLTETDAPWLSPFKDKRNEPAYVKETIKKIAEIKNISEKEVVEQIWQNYIKIFT